MARQYYFNKCIRRTVINFLALFNDIMIERYEQDGTVRGQYLVPLKFVPKSKAYMWATDKGLSEQMLPMMAVTMTGLDFDVNRMTNRHENIRLETNHAQLTAVYASNAVPYNISFALQIFALHNVDVDQIYEQILPWFNPHAFFIVNIPEMNLNFEVKVVLNSCSPLMTDDTTEEEARVIKWETQFQCQTYLFKPTSTAHLIGQLPFDPSPSASPAPPSAWSSESGWTGSYSAVTGESIWLPPSASDGGILARIHTDSDNWGILDVTNTNFTDAAETVAIQPVGLATIDGEVKILLDMEILGNS
jgi:hypothetical protein